MLLLPRPTVGQSCDDTGRISTRVRGISAFRLRQVYSRQQSVTYWFMDTAHWCWLVDLGTDSFANMARPHCDGRVFPGCHHGADWRRFGRPVRSGNKYDLFSINCDGSKCKAMFVDDGRPWVHWASVPSPNNTVFIFRSLPRAWHHWF